MLWALNHGFLSFHPSFSVGFFWRELLLSQQQQKTVKEEQRGMLSLLYPKRLKKTHGKEKWRRFYKTPADPRILGKAKGFFPVRPTPCPPPQLRPGTGLFCGARIRKSTPAVLPTTMYLYHYPTARLYYTASLLYLFCCCAAYVAGPYGPLPPALGGHLAVVRL